MTLISLVLFFYFVWERFGKRQAIFTSLIFLTTPIIFIHSHMVLDNIMPVPFVILWLLFLSFWGKDKKPKYLFWAGVVLGVAFYTYKAMRAIVPVWIILKTSLSRCGFRRSKATP